MYTLWVDKIPEKGSVLLRGSKSESNRLLVLQKLLGGFSISNLSDSLDTQVLQKGLNQNEETIDVGHAGTAMRFLTAYFAIQEGETKLLKGSSRMHQRPIYPLVDALTSMGAEITYLEEIGYPPLLIKGKRLTADTLSIEASVSSQFVTALLLIAPSLPNGMTLKLLGELTSIPYIQMTLQLLNRLGVAASLEDRLIKVSPTTKAAVSSIEVESDWSSASYLYSFFALSAMQEMRLQGLRKDSLQGDSVLQQIFEDFGVKSTWDSKELVLYKSGDIRKSIALDCSDYPDLAQTFAVTAYGLGIKLDLKGLHTLKIKETDRLVALQNELQKLGAEIQIDATSLSLKARSSEILKDICVATYEDHRMAMAFATLATRVPIRIEKPEVVIKSFPEFWQVCKHLGVKINKEF